MPSQTNILEVTLRDGSYEVNFSFTSADTENLCQALEEAGFEFIEIGHGVGLNASAAGYGTAMATDEEYLASAQRTLKKAKFGMFCIPGIARLEDIDMAAKYGMGFIRIGTNVTEVAASEAFIQRAKRHGMFVAANYMKSYALAPEDFAKQVLISQNYGADVVYVVDSAGGMFPADVQNYFEAIRNVSDIPLGFHGHDNLNMAVANSLAAAELGFAFVDSSLQGLGRSAGNAITESLVAALQKKSFDLGIDLFKAQAVGQKYILPLLKKKGTRPLDVISGYADFHSSYMPLIQEYAMKYQVDPAVLIIEMCKIDKVHIRKEDLDRVAGSLRTN